MRAALSGRWAGSGHDSLSGRRDRVAGSRGRLIPADVQVQVQVTRDYGATANEKANELLLHLGIATLSIVGLIALAVGPREAAVTAVVIPVTILLTLFASEVLGYTINRVSLFALIFSIGILVDDAIVVVESISRHWAMRDPRQAAIDAVAVGGQPDRDRNAHGDCSAAADAIRLRADGPLHGAHSGQRFRGHDLLVLRRGDGGALADAEACGQRPRRPGQGGA